MGGDPVSVDLRREDLKVKSVNATGQSPVAFV